MSFMTEPNGFNLFYTAFTFYCIATLLYLYGMAKNQTAPAKLGRAAMVAGVVLHTLSLVVITFAIGRPPFLNLFEYMLCFTWAAAMVYVATETLTRSTAFGAFCVPLIAVFVGFTARIASKSNQLDDAIMPALRSAWRVPHIGSAILAYGAFLMAFVLALMFLLREAVDGGPVQKFDAPGKKTFWGSRLPSAAVLDQTIYRTIAFGFLMQTVLVIVGAIWAQYAWGRFWGWDPKETWSFITWLIYATYLHTRTAMGWRGRKSAWLAITGFAATGFTFVGVSYLFHGLHSYGMK